MKDIRLVISASVDAAEREIEKLARNGEQASDRLSRAFETLGTKSTAAFEQQRNSVNKAYDSIKNSGVATADELTRAEKSRAEKIAAIDEEMFGKRTTLLEKFKNNWLAVTAATVAAWAAVTQAWGLAKEAATSLQEKAAFGNLAASHGAMADTIVADLKRASGETIATKELIQKSGTAMLMGIPAAELSRLMEIARASARVTGGSVSKSYEDIALAVARGSREILDNLGIVVSNEKAYQQYADSVGKSASQLTDAEKKQAFMNATLAAGDDMIARVGVTGKTTAEKMQSLEAGMQDLKEVVGRGVLAVFSILRGAFTGTAAAALFLSGAIFKVVQGISSLVGAKNAAQDYAINAEAAFAISDKLAKSAREDFSTSWDLLTGKIEPATKATKQMADQSDATAEAEKKRKEALKAAVGAIESYSKAVATLGAAQLKVAEGGFTRDLQRQEDYFKKNQSLAANLGAPLKNYLSVLDSVYGAQLAAQRDIENVLKRIGAEKKVQLEQQSRALQVEKAHSEASLKGWGDYLGKLKGMHSQAMDDIKREKEKLVALEDYSKNFNKELQEKFFPKPPETDPFLQFYQKLEQADAAQAAAMELTGDKRIEAIKKSLELLKGLPEEVVVGDDILISKQQAFGEYITRAQAWQGEMKAAQQAQIDTAQTAAQTLAQEIARVETAMATLEKRIVELDGKILSLSRAVTLTLDDQVTAGVENIRKALASLGSGVNASSGTSYVNVIPGAVSVNSLSSFALDGARASGGPVKPYATYRINEDGTEYLTMGGKGGYITPAGKGPVSQMSVQFGDVHLNLPNVTNQSTGADLARQALPEIVRLLKTRGIKIAS